MRGQDMRKLKAFMLGVRESRTDSTTNPGEELIDAYDRGRDVAHKVTLRRWDEE